MSDATDPVLDAAKATVTAFTTAAASGEEAAARNACTDAGWQDGDSPVRGLYMQSHKKGLVLDLMGSPRKLGTRAAQWVVLSHPSRPKPLGDLWVLLEDDDGWRIVGATKLRPHVGLFLWGHLPGALSIADMERSADGDRWAEGVLKSLQAGEVPAFAEGTDLLQSRLKPDNVTVATLRSVSLPEIHRAGVGFRFTTPDDDLGYDVWLILDTATREFPVVHATEFLGIEPLFFGIDVNWPQEDPDHPGRALSGIENPVDPEGGRIVLEELLRKVLVAAGADPQGIPDDDPRAAQIGQIFAALRRMAPRPGEDPTAPPVPTDPDAPMPLQLAPEAQQQVMAALEAIQAKAGTDTDGRPPSQEFLQDHGAVLVSSIFSALFRDMNPKAIQLTIPEPAPPRADGTPGGKRATIDPAALLGEIFPADPEE